MNRILRFHNIIQIKEIAPLTKPGSTFHRLTSTGTNASRGFPDHETNTLVMFIFYSPHLHVLLLHLLHSNVDHRSSLQTDILHASCTVQITKIRKCNE